MRKVSAKHIQWFDRELPVLEQEGVVSSDEAARLKQYYSENTVSGLHWAVIVFAILGSLLIGSGVILLFAHNWDNLGRPMRAVLSFCPLIIGSFVSLLALGKKGGVAFRESAGIFHSLAVGASIALIGQTYHLPSNTPAFMLSWSLLILPLMYLLRSTGSFLIYLGLICGWAGVAQETYGHASAFFILIIPPVIRLIQQVRADRYSPDTLTAFCGILLALTVSVGIVLERTVPGLWIVAYSAFLSGAGLLGVYLYGDSHHNIPKIFGVIGIVILAYILTWHGAWREVGWEYRRYIWRYRSWGVWSDTGVTLLLLTGWAATAVKTFRKESIETIVFSAFPLVSISCFLFTSATVEMRLLNAVIFNLFMLFFGVMHIVLGCKKTKLRQLNGGMAILSLLFITRFFDADFGFFARGIAFIVLGSCFLTANVVMARRKKQRRVV